MCGATLIATMTPGRWINLVAAALGAIGAIVLFNGSFAYESFPQYYSRDGEAVKAQTARNRRRQIMQRIGIGLILASFVVQGATQFLD
jgi:multisubunit Na+/H+ antiporter MnhG subunit